MAEPVTMSFDDYEKITEEWALAIGKFMVDFARCESWTHRYIQSFGPPSLHAACVELNLGPRADIARALVTDIGLTDAVQAKVDDAFKRLKKLSTQRNLVAHNGLALSVYTNDAQDAHYVVHEIVSERDPTKDIDLERLRECAEQTKKLDEDLALLFGEVRKPESQKPR